MKPFIDRTGQKYGRLIFVKYLGRQRWVLRCGCGAYVERPTSSVVHGNTSSCGCLRRELVAAKNRKHGYAPRRQTSRTYNTWSQMRDRCNNPRNGRFPLYGGRGIRVCARWNDYPTFLADMGEKPPGRSLDRVDVNGNYEPSNCRWATQSEQMQNVRHNRRVELGGETLCASEAARRLDMHYQTFLSRLRLGWSMERIAATRPRRGNNHLTAAV